MSIIAIVFVLLALWPAGKGITDTATHLIAAEQAKDDPQESLRLVEEGIRKGGQAWGCIVAILLVGVMALVVAAISGDPRMAW